MSIAVNVGKKYGLTIPSRAKGKVVARASAFCDDDDDDENCVENAALTESKAVKKVGSMTVLKRKAQLEIDKALAEDPTVYEYDAIYDKLQETKATKTPGAQKDKERKPKYIHTLLKTAEQRKKEYERRIERQVQKEREAEEGQFEDKETFVTSAYRKKMQEMAEEEENERRQAELEAKLDVTHQSDLSGFYRHLLRQTTGEEEVPDVTKVKTEPSNNETTVKQASSDIDFTEDRDATDSDSSTSLDSKSLITTRSKQGKHRHGSGSAEERAHDSITPERHSSRTSERQTQEPQFPNRQKRSSGIPERNRYRSRTPERKRYDTRTSDRKRYKSRSPERKRYRSRSSDRKRYMARNPERKICRSRTPETKRDRSRTPEKYHNKASSDSYESQNTHKKSKSKNSSKYQKEGVESASLVSDKQVEADSNKGNRKIKDKPETPQETKAQMWSVKFAKRNVGDTVEEARARYLARKQHRVVAVAVEQD